MRVPGSGSRSLAGWPTVWAENIQVESEFGHGSVFTLILPSKGDV